MPAPFVLLAETESVSDEPTDFSGRRDLVLRRFVDDIVRLSIWLTVRRCTGGTHTSLARPPDAVLQ
jgi:hypothetical protein